MLEKGMSYRTHVGDLVMIRQRPQLRAANDSLVVQPKRKWCSDPSPCRKKRCNI